MSTIGMDLMNRIHSGELQTTRPSMTITEVKGEISAALEEILEVGARIRPLHLGGEQVGWVRGVHLAERKMIGRWYTDPIDRIYQILRIATTLTDDELNDLDTFEFRTLVRVVTDYSNRDITLFPFVSAFTSTSMSETLWFARGASLSSFKSTTVDLLDGKSMRLLAAPDHARLWVTLAAARERAKVKLDDMFNAALIAKSMVGKGANKLFSDLQKSAKQLRSDIDDPWKEIVPVVAEDVNYNDGWGHAHQDNTEEGFWRESQGMINGDKHEAFMDKFYHQQIEESQQREAEMEKRYQAAAEWGGVSDSTSIVTEAEMRRRDALERAAYQQELLSSEDMNGDENAEDIMARRHLMYGRGFSNLRVGR